ncbi:hypothetical protein EPUS_05376 [Endocarpon pusillum Z07020]|uniref:Uncharacterized protein n=1 Tax=Endocarpon pusillum (strain Z07020 / HMAS-L-300199) TaxID=1263415 RepID=U1GNS4_ENDPU|nr:uncharacterized protein EPUS_05376 [Endocarpon pusillum Z07020]ERF73953.1 hypothetical protein EPUS_05376 [Endocarpon pusillum Z07020]
METCPVQTCPVQPSPIQAFPVTTRLFVAVSVLTCMNFSGAVAWWLVRGPRFSKLADEIVDGRATPQGVQNFQDDVRDSRVAAISVRAVIIVLKLGGHAREAKALNEQLRIAGRGRPMAMDPESRSVTSQVVEGVQASLPQTETPMVGENVVLGRDILLQERRLAQSPRPSTSSERPPAASQRPSASTAALATSRPNTPTSSPRPSTSIIRPSTPNPRGTISTSSPSTQPQQPSTPTQRPSIPGSHPPGPTPRSSTSTKTSWETGRTHWSAASASPENPLSNTFDHSSPYGAAVNNLRNARNASS